MGSKVCLKKARTMYEIGLKADYKKNPTKALEEQMRFRGLL